MYRARQEELDRSVVVKVLSLIDADATRRRFDRERRAMGRLSQAPGIAPLYGSGFTPTGQPYLLMPFYEQGSLQQQLAQHGPLAPEQVRSIGIRVARGVQTAHEHDVLHRDLKPANILLSRTGTADVADFGIAHLVGDALGTSQALTMTPLYTAPEVFDGVESAAADIYALGATLFALLNGHAAHSDPDGVPPLLSLMRRINEDPLPALPAHVPPGLVEIVAKAMHKDPTHRYESAADLAVALENADMSPPNRSGASRRLVVAVAALALAVAAGIGGAVYFSDASRTEVAEPTPTSVDLPTPLPLTPQGPTAVATPAGENDGAAFDLDTAQTAARQALVRIEAFSCTGAQVETGVVLNDGLIVTTERVAQSPWFVQVVHNGAIYDAQVRPSAIHPGLSTITVDDNDAFDVLSGLQVAPGDQVALVGIDGDPVVAAVRAGDGDDSLFAEVLDPTQGNPVEPADIVVSDRGALVGIASVGQGIIEIVTPDRLEDRSNPVSPTFDCPSLRRDLGPRDAESAVAPAIAELLTLQQLSDEYAGERWAAVRQLEPGKASLTDAEFIAGWRPLSQGFVYPVGRTIDTDGQARWRIALIGHETWSGVDLTTLFCVTWKVDPVSGAVTQTNEDNVAVYGSQPGQSQLPGFVDPSELRQLIDTWCPLAGT